MARTRLETTENSGTAVGDLLARFEQERLDHLRQIELLKLEVKRYRQISEDAQGRAAMLQSAMDRHMAHCDRDEGAVQRLRAELQEANARRKEQVAIIERREARIEYLLNGHSSVQKSSVAKGAKWDVRRLFKVRMGKRAN
ncbi:hypothetical protein GCM10023306_07110 [Novosphingobium ginsenosidimutans]